MPKCLKSLTKHRELIAAFLGKWSLSLQPVLWARSLAAVNLHGSAKFSGAAYICSTVPGNLGGGQPFQNPAGFQNYLVC